MAKYIDGFVIPVAKKNLPAYRRMAKLGCKVWMEHGALDYRETVAEDLDMPWGLGFTRGLKLKRGETVVFAYIVYRSRKDRDRINKKVMADPRMTGMSEQEMPFDMKRFMVAGFTTIVEG
jgi:uncharacterized protein YbaA (DUF1428 family)